MKKILSVFLSLSMALSLAACNKKEESSEPKKEQEETTEVVATTEPTISSASKVENPEQTLKDHVAANDGVILKESEYSGTNYISTIAYQEGKELLFFWYEPAEGSDELEDAERAVFLNLDEDSKTATVTVVYSLYIIEAEIEKSAFSREIKEDNSNLLSVECLDANGNNLAASNPSFGNLAQACINMALVDAKYLLLDTGTGVTLKDFGFTNH